MISIERAYQWKEEGRIHVSPHEAAEVLNADPYTLNICARVGSFGIAYFFSGSHLRISVQGIINYLEEQITHEDNEWLNYIPESYPNNRLYVHGVRMEAYPNIATEEEMRKWHL